MVTNSNIEKPGWNEPEIIDNSTEKLIKAAMTVGILHELLLNLDDSAVICEALKQLNTNTYLSVEFGLEKNEEKDSLNVYYHIYDAPDVEADYTLDITHDGFNNVFEHLYGQGDQEC